LIGYLLVALPTHSQNTLINKKVVTSFVDTDGDTMLIMSLTNGRKLLKKFTIYDLNNQELNEFILKDSLNNIKLQINDLISFKKEQQYQNCLKINENKEIIIRNREEAIETLEKEVNKQRTYKMLSLIGGGLLLVLTSISSN
jgi:hypothetical protein